jgi:PAS domain S-box-containing protein
MKTRHKTNGKVEILIAEDSPTQAAQLTYLLEQRDYKVTAAANGREALALLARHKPALVISDIVMPELDGYGLCRAIKADETLKDIPVMLVTTLSDSNDVIRGLECGADNFLRKPYEERYLLSRVDYLLMNTRLRKSQKMQMGMEIELGGSKHFISSDRQQILDLLISTYEQAVEINGELKQREKELAHSNQILQGLTRLAASLNGVTSEREVAETALRQALELPGVHAGWISLRTGESGFRLAATCGLPPALSGPDAFDGDCACRRQLLNGELATGCNIIKCDRLARAKGGTEGICSHASVPLWLGDGRALGVMNLAGEGNSLFSGADLELLYSVGNQVAVALERARMHENLEMLVAERTAKLEAEIEERKRIERQHLRLVSIIEATPDFVGTSDLAGHPIFINQAGLNMLGYEPGQGISDINTAEMYTGWAAKKVWEEGVPHAMEHGSWSGETALLSRDGTVIPVSQVIIAQEEADGEVKSLSTIMRDISERKRDEEALKRSQVLLNETGRLAAVGGWELNIDTGELLWTDELYRFYEVDRNFKPTLDKVLDFHAPSSKSLREQALRRAIELGEPFDLELEVTTAKGNRRWIHSIGRADPERRKVHGALLDITARKQAEIALRESRERLQRLLDSMFEAAYGVDIEGRCTFVNQSFLRMLGYQHADELLGQPIHSLIHHSHADGRPYPASECRMYRAYRANQAANVSDEVFWRSDGVAIPVEYWSHPIVADGEVTGAIATFIDITERKQAQAALLQMNETLEQKVVERTAELEQARHEADDANRAKSAFLSTMSHEIRTPMNALLGILELLALDKINSEQQRMLAMAESSGKSLLRIIDDILDFSKIEAGKLDIHPEPTAVTELIELTAQFFMPVARSKGLPLVYSTSPEISPALLADRLRLRQILNNFVSNAIKFTEQGQVEIRAELVAHLPGADRIRISVADTGVGISAETQSRLFQPFSQADTETTRRYGGSGLGLVICQRLSEMMGGRIELDSAPGKGTTLRLTLDLPVIDIELLQTAEATARTSVAAFQTNRAPSVAEARAAGTLVLLVDDHVTNREVLTEQLRILGYASEQAATSGEALLKWQCGTYALLITDCHMPDMDGYQLTRKIRQQEAETGRRRMPILAWTANAMQDVADTCAAAGMDDILIKPASLSALKEKLGRLLPLPSMPGDAEAQTTRPIPQLGTPEKVLDRAILRELSGGDAAMERKILLRFRTANQPDGEALGVAVAARDAKAVAHLAHRIKGAARMIGAAEYALACEILEQAGKSQDWPAVDVAQQRLDAALARLDRVIQE